MSCLTLSIKTSIGQGVTAKHGYAVAALIGGALATGFKLWALKTGVWEYTPRMSMVPVLRIELLPLIQLMVLPVLTYHISLAIVKAEM
ncbi:hypothetical protein C1N53_22620 (plasmid) [Pontibacter sp. SGAir0037]|nr:hypothetical protein C1N53_22620 [Pontibacter sp. SGAir0037]